MVSLISRLGDRLLNAWVPSVTASAISEMPQGCSPTCTCQFNANCPPDSDGFHISCCCINLACHVVCTCDYNCGFAGNSCGGG